MGWRLSDSATDGILVGKAMEGARVGDLHSVGGGNTVTGDYRGDNDMGETGLH